MAQHKAPTAVTFATPEDRSGLKPFVQRFWKFGAFLAIVGTALIIYMRYSSQEGTKRLYESWDAVHSAAQIPPNNLLTYGAKAEDILTSEAGKLRGTPAAPWALWIAATKASEALDWDKATQALQTLRQNYPNHPLVTDKFAIGPDGAAISMVEDLERRYQAQKAWRASHSDLFANPDPPADAPKVRIQTDRGDIVVALYTKEAPKHAENFLKLCREGFYVQTKFHRVLRNSIIMGGDPNTKSDDRTTWGQGGPGYKIDREENNLHHFAGILAAWKTGSDTQSSGSMFYITTNDKLGTDGQYVIFGKVLKGLDVAQAIGMSELEVDVPDRPTTPAVILATEVF